MTTKNFSEMFRCPSCGAYKADEGGRTCQLCGYRGDWIQPGFEHLYACDLYGEMGFGALGLGEAGCTCAELAKHGGLRVVHLRSDICLKDRFFKKNLAEGPVWLEPRTMEGVALHEAAHAVVAAAVGFEVERIEVWPTTRHDGEEFPIPSGVTSHKGPAPLPFGVPPEQLDARATVALAGQAAEQIGHGRSYCPCGHETGSTSDMISAERAAACAEASENESIFSVLMFGEKLPEEKLNQLDEIVQARKNRLYGEALALVQKHWRVVEKVAAAVAVNGWKLGAADLRLLLAEVRP